MGKGAPACCAHAPSCQPTLVITRYGADELEADEMKLGGDGEVLHAAMHSLARRESAAGHEQARGVAAGHVVHGRRQVVLDFPWIGRRSLPVPRGSFNNYTDRSIVARISLLSQRPVW